MKLFCRMSVCKECKNYFEPAPLSQREWGDLCPTHREPVMRKEMRKRSVVAWADANWEKLEEQKNKAEEEERRSLAQLYQNSGQQLYAQMAAAQAIATQPLYAPFGQSLGKPYP